MLFFWKNYRNSKLATFVSAIACPFLYIAIFAILGGFGTLFQGDMLGLAFILAGGASLAAFFLIRKGADRIAMNK